MSKIFPYILFLSIALGVYFLLHWFILWRISSGWELNVVQKGILRIVLIAGALTFPLGEVLARFSWSVPIIYCGFVWLGLLSFAFTTFLLEWLSGFFLPLGGRKTAVTVALASAILLSGYSVLRELSPPKLREIQIAMPKLPEKQASFTIVQVSDLHLGYHTPPSRLQDLVRRVNDLHPDLVVITGDLMDADICRSERFCAPLADFRSRYGVYAVSGNHEYYAGIDRFEQLAKQSGIHILNNRSVRINDTMTLAGLEDDQAHSFRGGGPDLEKALDGIDRDLPLVLLYHRPHGFPRAVKAGVDLQLSGHTHAGQIPPMDLLVLLSYKYPFGLHRLGNAHIYASFGTGTWGPPMRLFSRSEIVKISLKRPSS